MVIIIYIFSLAMDIYLPLAVLIGNGHMSSSIVCSHWQWTYVCHWLFSLAMDICLPLYVLIGNGHMSAIVCSHWQWTYVCHCLFSLAMDIFLPLAVLSGNGHILPPTSPVLYTYRSFCLPLVLCCTHTGHSASH